jgi:site-specific recombinase XerD
MDRTNLSPLLCSFELHLRAANRSDNTVESYLESARQAEAYLTIRGRTLLDARRSDLEAFIADLLSRRAPATAASRHKALRILYRWLEEEGEISASPMARMKPPLVPDQPVPIIPQDGLRRLLATCAGRDFDARRDTAIIMLLLDAGPRVGELIGMCVTDVDFDLEVVGVLGKGRRERALPVGRRTALAIDRYLRVRARHREAVQPWLWLGRAGRMTRWGIGQMLERRAEQARLPSTPAVDRDLHGCQAACRR